MAIEGLEERKLAAIMFTDMVGYSALAQRDEVLALELLGEHRAFLRPAFLKHQGQEVKTIGDGFLVEFASAVAAVNCAVELQEELARRNLGATADGQLQVRL
jgi:adenylate cyclase